MIRTKRNIALAPEERHELEVFTKNGKRSVKLLKRAAVIPAPDVPHPIGVSRLLKNTLRRLSQNFSFWEWLSVNLI
jgi:hypothetical protein